VRVINTRYLSSLILTVLSFEECANQDFDSISVDVVLKADLMAESRAFIKVRVCKDITHFQPSPSQRIFSLFERAVVRC
jgi:hypothetical protein